VAEHIPGLPLKPRAIPIITYDDYSMESTIKGNLISQSVTGTSSINCLVVVVTIIKA